MQTSASPLKRYNYIILDWDGNLAKTLDIWLDAFRLAFSSRGVHLTDSQIGALFGNPSALAALFNDPRQAFAEADAIAKSELPLVELYPGARELLLYLHRAGKHTALITSSLRDNVTHLLEKHRIQDLFEATITDGDITNHKPHPEPLEKALNQLGGTKDETIIIGDSDKDLGAALNFGIDSILFHEQSHEKFYPLAELEKLHPTYVVDKLLDIKQIII